MDVRDIPYYPGYKITDNGRVLSSRCELRHSDRHGYASVQLWANGIGKMMQVHRLVLLAWIGHPPSSGSHTRHLDGNKRNNSLSNLRWGTPKENGEDQVRLDRAARGERSGAYTHPERLARGVRNGMTTRPESIIRGENHPKSKLKYSDVIYIRSRIAHGESHRSIAISMGVSRGLISHISTRRAWRHI